MTGGIGATGGVGGVERPGGVGGLGGTEPGRPLDAGSGPDRESTLEAAARDFESVLIQEMLKAMRATVPEGGLLDAGRGEEIFTSLLDEHIAAASADRSDSDRTLAQALYRQLTGRSGT